MADSSVDCLKLRGSGDGRSEYPGVGGMSLSSKPTEYFVAVGSAMVFVVLQHKDKPFLARVAIAAVSGGVGYALAADFALWTGRSEVLGAFLLTAFGFAALDLASSLLADRKFLKSLISKRMGGPS